MLKTNGANGLKPDMICKSTDIHAEVTCSDYLADVLCMIQFIVVIPGPDL